MFSMRCVTAMTLIQTIDHINDVASLAGGVVLCLLCMPVIYYYWDAARVVWRRDKPTGAENWLAAGIVVGFIGIFVNTAYWSIGFRGALVFDMHGLFELMRVYGPVGDLFFKLFLSGAAAYCHLRSAWMSLPDSERGDWNWLTVVAYPRKRHLVVRMLGYLQSALPIRRNR